MADDELTLPYWLRNADDLLKRVTIDQCFGEGELLSTLLRMKEDLMKVVSVEMGKCTGHWSPSERETFRNVWAEHMRKHEGEQFLFRREYLGEQWENETTARAMAVELADYRWKIRHLIHHLRDERVRALPGMKELLSQEYCASEHFVLARNVMCGIRELLEAFHEGHLANEKL